MISVIIPAFNEEHGIGPVLEKLGQTLDRNDSEVIVIDDGSSDATAKVVQKFSDVRLLRHPNNKGYGSSLKTGIRAAKGDKVIFFDADGQHDAKDISRLCDFVGEYDMVVGTRGGDSHAPALRRPGKKVLGLLANFLSGTHIPDLNSGLRAFKRSVILKYLHLLPHGFSASTTSTMVMLSRGYNVKWVPIKVEKRVGKSSVKQLRDGTQTILLMIRLVALFSPLKLFFPLSWMSFLFGFCWGLFYYLKSADLSTLAVLCMLTGVIIFLFGILCDQIASQRLERFEEDRAG